LYSSCSAARIYDGNVCHYELNYDVLFVVPLFIYLTFYFILLFLFFNRVSINYTEWPMIPACPSLICLFVFVFFCVVCLFVCFFVVFFVLFSELKQLKGLTLRKFEFGVCVCMFCFIFVFGVCFIFVFKFEFRVCVFCVLRILRVCVLFYICVGTDFVVFT